MGRRLNQYLTVFLVAVLLLGSAPGVFAATNVTKEPVTIGLLDDILTSLGFKPHPRPKPNPKQPPTRTTVPEPATLAMLALGLAGVGVLRRKKAE